MEIDNGYYVSAYCAIDSLGNILNTELRHDQNIALWKVEENNVELIHHWELERISGLKHHHRSFYNIEDFYKFLDELLNQYNLNINLLKGIFGTPEVSTINNYYKNNSELSYHSLTHLFSSIFVDSNMFYKDNIIALALDAEPDFVVEENAKKKLFYSGAFSRKGKIEYFPISSPGIFWSCAREHFKIPEGTLMALAYACKSFVYKTYNKIDVYNFEDTLKAERYIKQIIREIFSYTKDDEGVKFSCFDENFSEYDNKVSMVMKVIQEISIKNVEETINKIINKYDIETSDTCLSLSGGYSLNCPTNTHLMQKFKFKKLLMAPCVNDGGHAIGIGIKYFFENIQNINFKLENAYYGDKDDTIQNLLNKDNEFYEFIESVEDGIELIAEDLINGPIVWFNQRAEVGPRALGHRSILADPRQIKSKDLLNIYKKREWWRPVAPIVLENACSEWFENSFESPFMLNNFKIKKDKRDMVPAVLHLDDTSRVQTINDKEDLLYSVVQCFYNKTGVPIICNTSLNDKGEPIINTINQALNFALRKKISIVYVNGNRIKLKSHDNYTKSLPITRSEDLFLKYSNDESLVNNINKYKFDEEDYYIYKTNPELKKFDITNEHDAQIIKAFCKKAHRVYENMTR